jgi:hypothetical protein
MHSVPLRPNYQRREPVPPFLDLILTPDQVLDKCVMLPHQPKLEEAQLDQGDAEQLAAKLEPLNLQSVEKVKPKSVASMSASRSPSPAPVTMPLKPSTSKKIQRMSIQPSTRGSSPAPATMPLKPKTPKKRKSPGSQTQQPRSILDLVNTPFMRPERTKRKSIPTAKVVGGVSRFIESHITK